MGHLKVLHLKKSQYRRNDYEDMLDAQKQGRAKIHAGHTAHWLPWNDSFVQITPWDQLHPSNFTLPWNTQNRSINLAVGVGGWGTVEVKLCAPWYDTFRFLKGIMFRRANKTFCRASQLQRFFGKVNKEQEQSENGTNFRVDV